MSFSSTNNNDNMANSSSDFVSADVNEVLQDARQNLTNREQQNDGQHPNELGESTTVQVTKQGGDEDPMEVTAEEAETEERESRTSTTIMDLAGNIWTILIGCLAFLFIFLWFITRPDTYIQFQMIAVMGLAAIVIVVSLWNKFKDKLYRPLRAGIFSCIGLSVTETWTTMMGFFRPRHRKLPPELNEQIFLFLKPAAQRKFIWGLGWDFYAMFRYRLLTKSKRVRNPTGNQWNRTNTRATVMADGLSVSNYTNEFPNVFAVQPFPISGPHCRADDFPGTILYYYEVKGRLFMCLVGLSDSAIPDNSWIGGYSNSYAIPPYRASRCWLAEDLHPFELPEGANRPERKYNGNVYGCGLVLDSDNNLAIFFTLNGQLLGRKFPIRPTVDRLFPAVKIWNESSFEANFGDDPAKPFVYDIHNCPGLELACI